MRKTITTAALVATSALVLAGCGSDGFEDVEDVAAAIGCEDVEDGENLANVPEVDCRLDGAEVEVTDWRDLDEERVSDALDGFETLGYRFVEVPDGFTVASRDRAAVEAAASSLDTEVR